MSGIASEWRGLSLWVRDGLLALVLTVVGQVELVLLADEVVGSRPLQHVAFARHDRQPGHPAAAAR